MVFFDDVTALLTSLGSWSFAAILFIVFAESGLFFGFFLPGDSLLFTAGLLASSGFFDVRFLVIGIAIAAIAGDQVGYWMGAKFGRGFFNKPGSIFFNPKHIDDAEAFYKKHGKKTIVLARFVPVIRTFAPIVAGIVRMDYPTFVSFNIIGGCLWAIACVLSGYFLGRIFPQAGEYITYLVLVIVILSTIPIVMEILKRRPK